MKKLSSISLITLLVHASVGQDIPLEAWRTHFSYTNGRLLAKSPDKIFCAAENGIFSVDLTDNSLDKLNKTHGLSDVSASAIAFDERTGTLVIGYPSGLVDLVSSEGVITLREINETNLQGNKQIHDITFFEDKAFIATSFGVIVIAMDRKEITETYASIGPGGTDATVFETQAINDQLFAATEIGIQSGPLNENLLDFNNWTHYSNPENSTYSSFEVFENAIYCIENTSTLVTLQDQTWEEVELGTTAELISLFSDDGLYLLTHSSILRYSQEGLTTHIAFENAANANAFLYQNGFWIADSQNGLVDPGGQNISPNGPYSDGITKIRFTGNRLFTFFAPKPDSYFGQVTHNNYSDFNNSTWETKTVPDFYNIADAASFNGDLYFSSTGFGLYQESEAIIMDHTNSSFTQSKSGNGVIIPELASSSQLYIPAYDNPNSLYTLGMSGDLTAYTENFVGTDRTVAVDLSQRDVLWLTRSTASGGGVITLDLVSEDYRLITGNDNLPGNINDIRINLADEAWVATTAGPSFFGQASFIFDGMVGVSPIFDGFNLFENQQVTAISTDGGNGVWMGTSTGVSLFDDAISEQVGHFSVDNSPLPSNNILEFAYNSTSGEMFILTDKGLVSYRSTSSNPPAQHQSVRVFPNPVRPGYTGLVGITGIASGASVKITDVNGKVIRELEVNGGTASWDVQDYNRRRVQGGIYVIFSATGDGEETYIGKIAVIN